MDLLRAYYAWSPGEVLYALLLFGPPDTPAGTVTPHSTGVDIETQGSRSLSFQAASNRVLLPAWKGVSLILYSRSSMLFSHFSADRNFCRAVLSTLRPALLIPFSERESSSQENPRRQRV